MCRLAIARISTTGEEVERGQIFGGHYEIIGKIGQGGMSTVWKARDTRLNRIDAIKIMSPQYAGDSTFTMRFKQEAQTAANIRSPYIVDIYDWNRQGDSYFIAMEFLEGNDLKQIIKHYGAIDTKRVARIAMQVCSALAAAHRREIIHRDIKPQNIMVLKDGNIKVMDFGIAQPKNSHLTQDNAVLGTAHYVSPEQARGQQLGPTTDIYSLGVVMYEACTGRLPFEGDDAISVAMKQISEQPVPPSQINPNVDPAFESIVLKCMSKSPNDRYQTADELRTDLDAYMRGNVQGMESTQRIETIGEPTKMMNRPQMTQDGQQDNNGYDPEAEEAEEKKKRRIIIGSVIGGIVALVAIIAAVVAFGAGTPQISVPNVVGQVQEEAIKQLTDAGLTVNEDEIKQEHSDEEEGTVIDQDPDEGTMVDNGTEVTLTVSSGPEMVKVPDLVGKSADVAAKLLEDAGLKGEINQEYDPNTPDGNVISQQPNKDTEVESGSSVKYTISLGTETADVPEVGGKDADDAEAELRSAGFDVKRVEDTSDSVPEGNVISQDVTGRRPVGSTVTITVSSGKGNADVLDVTGNTVDDARASLEDLGFVVNVDDEERDGTEPAGTVVGYTPTGSQPIGSTITLTVASGSNTIPNVVGNILSDAVAKLENAGFRVAGTSGVSDDAVVASQTLTGRSEIGTTVTLTFRSVGGGGSNSNGNGNSSNENTAEPLNEDF